MEDLFSRPDFFQLVANADPNLIIVKDRDGRFRFVNQAAAEYHGVRPCDMIGKLESEFYLDQSLAEKYREEDELVYKAAKRIDFGERHTVDCTGKARWLRSTKIPLYTDDGDIDGIALIVTDVTFRLQAQKKEQMISEGLRALVKTSEELLTCPDVDALCETAVTRAREKLGLERCFIYRAVDGGMEGTYGTNLLGETVDERGVEKPLDCYNELLDQLRQGGGPWKVFNFPREEQLPGHEKTIIEGWLCVTLMKSNEKPLGMLLYDAAISGEPFKDDMQEVVYTYATLIGTMMERKLVELEAREHSREYRQLFDQSPAANLIVTTSGEITACNESFARLVRCDQVEEAIKLDVRMLLGAEQFKFFRKMLRKYHSVDNYETCIQLPDGTQVPVILNMAARWNKAQEITGFHGMIMDISEQKSLEAALEELDRGTALRGDGAFFLELARHVTEAMNVKGAYVLELSSISSDVVKTLGGVWDGEGLEGKELPIEGSECEEVLKSGYFMLSQGLRKRHHSYELYKEVSAESYMGVLLKGADGVPLGILAVLHDRPLAREERLKPILHIFASRASAEIQRRRSDEKLQRSQAEFLQIQKMEAVGRLAGGIAHDFNNILTSILGISDLILFDLEKGTTMYEDIEQIKKSAERAASLTRQLLAFSRKQVMQTQVFDLGELISEMKVMKPLLGERIALSLHIAEDELCIKADQAQLEQVLLNVVINSRDAIAKHGEIKITADVHVEKAKVPHPRLSMKQGMYVHLAIEDTGAGMEAGIVERVFEPFFTTKPKGQGTGLGLPMVYGIVSQSGGYIDIESKPGKGTAVHIYLPQTLREKCNGEYQSRPMPTVGGDERILLVEDEDEVRAPLKAALERYGYTVFEARNSEEAFLVLENEEEIHLMVSDVTMPHLAGPAPCERVSPSRPDMKVLFISGFGDEQLVEHVQRAGVDSFLQKPFAPGQFLKRVRALLDGAVDQREAPAPEA